MVGRRRNVLFSIESTDKFDSNTIALDCSDEEFRSIEASLCQVLHRTTANEPLKIVQQTKGQKGFEAWHAIVRRYDQRNMSDKNSAKAALISNIFERAHSFSFTILFVFSARESQKSILRSARQSSRCAPIACPRIIDLWGLSALALLLVLLG